MHNIETSIGEYCAENLPSEPFWITVLNRRFPRITVRCNLIKSMKWEFEDHLRNSYEAYLSKGEDPESAWKLAREHFGDVAVISREIRKARMQSETCILIRLLAVFALIILPLGNYAGISIPSFIQGTSLGLMAACAAAGFLITRKRDSDSLREYALYGAWFGLLWGVYHAITVDDMSKIGSAIAITLISTFYGLFLAAPSRRGIVPPAMMGVCQAGVLISLIRFGLVSPYPGTLDASVLKTAAIASLITILVGLIFFDIRRVHRRLAGMAAFGMVSTYIQILCNLSGAYPTIFDFLFATSIPPLIAVLVAMQIPKLQNLRLKKAL